MTLPEAPLRINSVSTACDEISKAALLVWGRQPYLSSTAIAGWSVGKGQRQNAIRHILERDRPGPNRLNITRKAHRVWILHLSARYRVRVEGRVAPLARRGHVK